MQFTLPVRALKAAAKMAGNDPYRPLLNLVYINKHGIYATDSYVAYRYKAELNVGLEKPIAFPPDSFKSLKGKVTDLVSFTDNGDGLWTLNFITSGSHETYIKEHPLNYLNNLPGSIDNLFDEHPKRAGKIESLGLGIKYLDKIIKAAKVVNTSPNLRFDFSETTTRKLGGEECVVPGAAIITSTNSEDIAEFLIMPVRL